MKSYTFRSAKTNIEIRKGILIDQRLSTDVSLSDEFVASKARHTV